MAANDAGDWSANQPPCKAARLADQFFRGFLLVIGPVLADSWGVLVGQYLLAVMMRLLDWTTWMMTGSQKIDPNAIAT